LALFNDFVAKRRYFYEKSSIFLFWTKQMMFLNKNKGAISKMKIVILKSEPSTIFQKKLKKKFLDAV